MNIRLANSDQVIAMFKETVKPLSPHMIASLDQIQTELIEAEIPTNFNVLIGKCRICNNEQITIIPSVADLDNMECGNCGNMTLQEKDDEETYI